MNTLSIQRSAPPPKTLSARASTGRWRPGAGARGLRMILVAGLHLALAAAGWQVVLRPEHPPTEALGYLQEALKFQELVTVALMAAKEETARELQQMSSRQTGARGYVSAVHADAPRVSQISRQS